MSDNLVILLNFEPAETSAVRGPLIEFAEEAYEKMRSAPLIVPDSLCGQAARVASGILVPERCLHETEGLRLRSITCGETELLRRDHDEFGRLAGVSYPDGVRVSRSFDGRNRLQRVGCGKSPQILYSWNDFGILTEIQALPGGRKFGFRWDEEGRRVLVTNPCGTFKWKWKGERLAEVEVHDGCRMAWNWDANGEPTGFSVSSGGQSLAVDFRKAHYGAVSCPAPQDGETGLLSALGYMRFDSRRRVVFWISATGEPMWLHHDAEGRVSQVWTAAGPNLIEYGEGGSFSILNANGDRFLLWPTGKAQFLMTGPEGVEHGRWLSNHRPASLLGMWGDSTVFSYGLTNRGRLPVAVESPQWGKLRMRHTKSSGFESVEIEGTGRFGFVHTEEGMPQSLTLEAPSNLGALALLRLSGFFFAVRSSGESGFASSFLWGRHIRH